MQNNRVVRSNKENKNVLAPIARRWMPFVWWDLGQDTWFTSSSLLGLATRPYTPIGGPEDHAPSELAAGP